MGIISDTNVLEGRRIIPLPPGANPDSPPRPPAPKEGRRPLQFRTPLERLRRFTTSRAYLDLPIPERHKVYERFSRLDPFSQEEALESGKLPIDLSRGGTGPDLISEAINYFPQTIVGTAVAPFRAKGREAIKETFKGDPTALRDFEESLNLPKGVKPLAEALVPIPGLGFGAKASSRLVPTATRALAREGVESIEEAGVRKAITRPQIPAVQKLTALVKQAEPVREATEILKSKELSERVGVFTGIAKGGRAEGAFGRATTALKGELPKAVFAPVRPALTPEDIDSLYSINRNKWLESGRPLNGLNTETALTKVLTGELPTESEIGLLEETFGLDLAKALLSKRSLPEKLKQEFLSAVNLPKALVASADLSAPMRQGIWLAGGHLKEWFGSMAPMVRAFASESTAQSVDDAIRSRARWTMAEEAGLYHAPIGVGARLSQREEAYMTRFAQYFPWVRWSERAYVTYLNKLRSDVFDNVVNGWERGGKKVTKRDISDLADFINKATGRGDFGKTVNEYAPLLNAAFFSARNVISRVQTPLKLLTARGEVRKLIAKDLVAFVGTGMTILGLLKAAGVADVETSTRSSDFGKLRIGPTRYDFWGGEQPIARFIAQTVTGQRKAISTGEIQDTSRKDTALRFMRSKLSPSASLLADYLSQETFFGAPLEEEGLIGEIKRTVVPILIQDLWEAIQEQQLLGGLVTLPSALGVGIQTFYPTGEPFSAAQRTKLITEIPEKGVNIEREEALRQASSRERREFRESSPEAAKKLDERKLKKIGGLSRELLELKMERTENELTLEREVTAGKISLTQFAERYRSIQRNTAVRADQANRKADIYGDEPPKDPLRRAVYDYYQVYKGAQIPGGLDFERVETELADLERQWTAEQKAYVAENVGQTEHQSPLARAYEADKNIIKTNMYWDAHKELSIVLKYPGLSNYYDEWRIMGDSAFKLKNGEYTLKLVKGIVKAVGKAREEKRQTNPELDAALVKWYGYKPKTILGAQWKVYMDRQLAGVK